jgi:hypothetical protein
LGEVGNALDEMSVDSDWIATPDDLADPMYWYERMYGYRPPSNQPLDKEQERHMIADELCVEEYELYTDMIQNKGGSAKKINRLRELRGLNASSD